MAHLLEYLVVGDRTCSITNRQIRCKFILTVILILDFLLHVDKWNTWAHVNDPPRRGYSHLLKSAFFQEKMPWKETYISEKYRVWGFQNRSYLNPSWSSWPSTGRSTWGTSAAMGIKNWSLKLKSFYINQGWEKLLHKSHKNILFMKIWTLFTAPTVKTPRQKVIKWILKIINLKTTLLPKLRVLYNFGR